MMNARRFVSCLVASTVILWCSMASAYAQSKNLAPGFSSRAATSKLVVVPVDIELFSLSAGGVPEPKADWTQAATKHFASALKAKSGLMGSNVSTLSEAEGDEFSELSTLHGAVAMAIFQHHMLGLALPTKDGKLSWTLGDAVAALRAKSGADYALFTWVRDSYASSERKVAMVALALVGVGIAGGTQVGYASLVDLKTGQVMWFNHLLRPTGDLREEKPALDTVTDLLKGFPPVQ
jgi:hypothetical protein